MIRQAELAVLRSLVVPPAGDVCVVAQKERENEGLGDIDHRIQQHPRPTKVWGIEWDTGGPMQSAPCLLRLPVFIAYAPHHRMGALTRRPASRTTGLAVARCSYGLGGAACADTRGHGACCEAAETEEHGQRWVVEWCTKFGKGLQEWE